MKDKKWLIVTALLAVSAAAAFATGVSEDDADPAFGPRGGRGPAAVRGDDDTVYGMRGGRDFGPQDGRRPFYDAEGCLYYDDEVEFDVYEGTFSMVDGLYPALVTEGGETYYLMPHFPLAADDIPEDGSDISVEALPSRISPVHLAVFAATVDGEELEPDWDALAYGPGMGGPGRGGYGMRGGPGRNGGPGMRGGPGMYGGPGRFGAPYEDDRWNRRPYWFPEAPEDE